MIFLRSPAPGDPHNALWAATDDGGGRWSERLLFDPAGPAGSGSTSAAMNERLRERASGVTRFSAGTRCRRVAFQIGGDVWRCDVEPGECRRLEGVRAGAAALLAPDGTRLAVAGDGGVGVYDVTDPDRVAPVAELLSGEGTDLGVPDFIAAEEIHRFDGMWWSPDSRHLLMELSDAADVPRWTIAEPARPEAPARRVPYPVAGGPNARLSLRLLDCASGEIADIEWSHDDYPYLWNVVWSETGGLTVELESRDQRRLTTFRCDLPGLELTEVARVESDVPIPVGTGTRAHGPDGQLCRVLDTSDTRTLTVGDVPARLPEQAQVAAFIGRTEQGSLIQVAAPDPSARVVALAGWDGSYLPLTRPQAVAVGWGGGATVVVQEQSLDGDATATRILSPVGATGAQPASAPVATNGLRYAWDEQVRIIEVEPGRVRSALLEPSWYEPGMGPLPVLVSSYGGPMSAKVVRSRASHLGARWFAEQGFAVLVTDGVGVAGVGPRAESGLYGDFSRTLDSQVAAVERVVADRPHLDGDRVGIRGWSFGGYLAALAAIRAPEVFRAAVAGAPVTDWMLYDTHYTERYLGTGDELQANARRSSLDLALEESAERRVEVAPILLIHGLSDDNVFAAHAVRLSEALIARRVLHTALLPSSLTHITRGSLTADLMYLELSFLATHLQPLTH